MTTAAEAGSQEFYPGFPPEGQESKFLDHVALASETHCQEAETELEHQDWNLPPSMKCIVSLQCQHQKHNKSHGKAGPSNIAF